MNENSQLWKADHARVTFFKQDLWNVDAAAFLSRLGLAVEGTFARPAHAEVITTALLDDLRRLEVKQQANRLEFTVGPRLDRLPVDGPPMLENASEEIKGLVERILPWAEANANGAIRVAVGCGGYFGESGREATYLRLAKLLPIVRFDSADRDFQLRINKPVQSRVLSKLPLNVLGTWASVEFHGSMVGMGSQSAYPAGVTQFTSHFVQCIVDVNTDAFRAEPLPSDSLGALLEELAANAVRVLVEGAR